MASSSGISARATSSDQRSPCEKLAASQELPQYQPLMVGLNLIEHQDSSAYIPVVWDKTTHAHRVYPLPRHRGRR
jgi:hypothetical protein